MKYIHLFAVSAKTFERIGEEKVLNEILKIPEKKINPSLYFLKISQLFKGKDIIECHEILKKHKEKIKAKEVPEETLKNLKKIISELMEIDSESLFEKSYTVSTKIKNSRVLFFTCLRQFYGYTNKSSGKPFNFSTSLVQSYVRTYMQLDSKIAEHNDILEKYKKLIQNLK